jgi:DUF4097 and DUF4098 domain-containing protein YvlB
MKKKKCAALIAIIAICLLSGITGCEIPKAKYEITRHMSAPLAAGSSFGAVTHNGAIRINGRDESGCDLTATITARASTEEKAKKLAEKTKVSLKNDGDKLNVEIKKPTLIPNQSVSVSLDAELPNKTNLHLITHNGAVTVTGIQGRVDATTHNGRVKTSNVMGQNKLQTHNGAVVCEQISGDAWLSTHNGGINASYAEDASGVCQIIMTTHNGSINLKTPPNISAAVNLSTHNGSINTELPITLIGKVSKNKINGKIGDGQGKLKLETHNGSIKIR